MGENTDIYQRNTTLSIAGEIFTITQTGKELGYSYSTQWGTQGAGNGQLQSPRGVAVDEAGNVYVADTDNNRIQKFDSAGNYLTKWGSAGTGEGKFQNPVGIAADQLGLVYITDAGNNRIQVFNSYGTYIAQWKKRLMKQTSLITPPA